MVVQVAKLCLIGIAGNSSKAIKTRKNIRMQEYKTWYCESSWVHVILYGIQARLSLNICAKLLEIFGPQQFDK